MTRIKVGTYKIKLERKGLLRFRLWLIKVKVPFVKEDENYEKRKLIMALITGLVLKVIS